MTIQFLIKMFKEPKLKKQHKFVEKNVCSSN